MASGTLLQPSSMEFAKSVDPAMSDTVGVSTTKTQQLTVETFTVKASFFFSLYLKLPPMKIQVIPDVRDILRLSVHIRTRVT